MSGVVWRVALSVLSLLVTTVGLAPRAAESVENPNEPILEEEVEVVGSTPEAQSARVESETLESGRFSNLGQAFEDVAGVAALRRGANMTEPVIRGLGWERVQTQVNGTPLHGACPARMDPPVCALSPGSVREARVSKGLGSVTLGPAGTGGRLVVSTSAQLAGRGAEPFAGRARLGWDAAREGLVSGIGASGGLGALSYRAGLEVMSFDDYESSGGLRVPAGQKERSGHLSLGHRIAEGSGPWISVIVSDAKDVDYPALPMNSEFVNNRLYQAGYDLERERGALARASATLGYATTDHFMSNRGKPNRAAMEAETPSYADTRHAALLLAWRLGARAELRSGLDFVALERDARRERRMVTSGMTFYDHLWPEVSQEDLGLFAELELGPYESWRLRIGGRYDDVTSEAAAADDPSLMLSTVRENYARFYGDDALETDRTEGLVSGNLLLERVLSPGVTIHAGVGVARRAASTTERYFAFAPAPGGFAVGNPTLDAESKRELAAGLEVEARSLTLSASVYYYDFADYIHTSLLDVRDVNGDGRPDRLRGYENVDAKVYGFEASLAWAVGERWTLPAAIAYVRARNEDSGSPLPEIPPLELRMAGRYRIAGRLPGWIELGTRIVDDQARIDESFGENETESFEVWHLRARLRVHGSLELELGVENLLDDEYNEHLTREALLAVGDLAAGDEVPQPGRSLVVAMHASF